jgi:Protein of unknown function (DUF3467)
MAEDPEEVVPNIMIQPEQMSGTWANYARVSHSPYEFTLDFVRLDFSQSPPEGIVVSRVSVSPLFIDQLIEALGKNWEIYARKALPPEIHKEQTDEESEEDGS